MKHGIVLCVLLFFSNVSGFGTTHTITSSGFTFSPADISISQGDTVIFTLAAFHNAQEVTLATWNANDTTWNHGFFVPFGGGTLVLAATGTHYYVCKNHAAMGMKGKITVNAPANPPPPAPALLFPSDQSSVSSTVVTLGWTSANTATSYRLQVATDSLFSAPFFDDSTLADTTQQLSSLVRGNKYYWHVDAKNDFGKSAFSASRWFLVTDTTLSGSPHLSVGWNMISVPVRVSDFLYSAIFSGAASKPFMYENGYFSRDTLVNGPGFWLKYPVDTSFTITGTAIPSETVAVHLGWNMIGSITQPVLASNITALHGGVIASSFFRYAGSYQLSDTIKPGYGYWVKVDQADSLIISSAPPLLKAHRNKVGIVE